MEKRKVSPTLEKEIIENLRLNLIIGEINVVFITAAIIVFINRIWPDFPTLLVCSLVISLPLGNLLSLLHYKKYKNINVIFLRFCLFDTLILTTILHYAGDMKATLGFIYLVAIIMSAAIFSLRRIILLISIYAFSYLNLILLETFGIIPRIHCPGLQMPLAYFWTSSSISLILMVTVGFIIAKAITQRREKERELLQAREYTDNIIKSMVDTLMVIDPQGRIKTVNPATINLLDYKEEELIGKSITKIFFEKEEEFSPFKEEKIKNLVDKGVFKDYDIYFKSKKGDMIPIHLSASKLKDKDENLIGILAIGRDMRDVRRLMEKEKELAAITAAAQVEHERAIELEEAYRELKETRDMLIQAEKLSAVGQLASGVAHEVKNPLGTLLQGINYLEKKLSPLKEDISKVLKIMVNNIQRADNIIRALLDFSRASHLNLKPEKVVSIIEESLILVEQKLKFKQHIHVKKEIEEDLPQILADKTKMEQIFVNIFLNSIQAMPKGGTITIRAKKKILDNIKERVGRREGDFFTLGEEAVIIEVEDTGVGISKENLKRVFDPFFTTKSTKEGTGLGLAVTLNIINEHKGLIEIESKLGKGTKVILTLKTAKNL